GRPPKRSAGGFSAIGASRRGPRQVGLAPGAQGGAEQDLQRLALAVDLVEAVADGVGVQLADQRGGVGGGRLRGRGAHGATSYRGRGGVCMPRRYAVETARFFRPSGGRR